MQRSPGRRHRILPRRKRCCGSAGSRPAIADDELSYDLATTAFDADTLSLDPLQTRLADAFGEPAPAPRRLTMETNDYARCAGHALRPRLFGDFNDADTVLVIHDATEFTRRPIQAIRDPRHGWQITPGTVHDFDPYHPSQQARHVFACKHFKYLYQEEFRYVFLPPSPVTRLEPLSLELGSLGDISRGTGQVGKPVHACFASLAPQSVGTPHSFLPTRSSLL
ncbi:hypothetical protein LY625_00810 [Lysobacter sp. GX 14042]|uniref:hypothetical protein n=1 Tax=Lysobacter sp. GX 14042 TaxID=2907155 RepID=UPI001F1DFDF4|nr:hypothetical protein [Lysobacter sp. GX 14042]MCE7031179.1 hypothetical protein [Lysobacter sp. GX 14042]